MPHAPLALSAAALLLAALSPAATSGGALWPEHPACVAHDLGPVHAQVCVGGSICYAVGGQTHVFVCVSPHECPDADVPLPDGTCVGQDADGDGWSADEGDCDDADPSIHPDHPEDPFNGVDDDCDGMVDEGGDQDADGWTEADGDCDDDDASVNPGADEDPQNGIDDDCDGAIDEE